MRKLRSASDETTQIKRILFYVSTSDQCFRLASPHGIAQVISTRIYAVPCNKSNADSLEQRYFLGQYFLPRYFPWTPNRILPVQFHEHRSLYQCNAPSTRFRPVSLSFSYRFTDWFLSLNHLLNKSYQSSRPLCDDESAAATCERRRFMAEWCCIPRYRVLNKRFVHAPCTFPPFYLFLFFYPLRFPRIRKMHYF